jgi:hypothetical protein
MGCPQPVEAKSPDKQTLQAWEDMRIEIWHELQEGACADVPDTLIDEIGELVVLLKSKNAETGL